MADRETFIATLRAGETIKFSRRDPINSRIIDPQWLLELARDGAVRDPVRVEGAVFQKAVKVRYLTFSNIVSFVDCEFSDVVDFTGSVFESAASFQGSRFREATRFSSIYAKSFNVGRTVFEGLFEMRDSVVAEVLNCGGALFAVADCQRLHVNHLLLGRPRLVDGIVLRTTFRGRAKFNDARLATCDLSGAIFEDDANFRRVETVNGMFAGTASIDTTGETLPGGSVSAIFRAEVYCGMAKFASLLDIAGSRFLKKVDFAGVKVAGPCYAGTVRRSGLNYPTVFESGLDCRDMVVEQRLDFSGATFGGDVTLDRIAVHGDLAFDAVVADDDVQACSFSASLSIRNANIDGNVTFGGVELSNVSLVSAAVGNLYFLPRITRTTLRRTAVKGSLSLLRLRVAGDLSINAVDFRGAASFESVQIGGRIFLTPTQFGKDKLTVQFAVRPTFLDASIASASIFQEVVFCAGAVFEAAQFGGRTVFTRSQFLGEQVSFRGASFQRSSFFNEIRCAGTFAFSRVRASGATEFDHASFEGAVEFDESEFGSTVSLRGVSFKGESCRFVATFFDDDVVLLGAEAFGDVNMTAVQIGGSAVLDTFLVAGALILEHASFEGAASFVATTVEGNFVARGAQFASGVVFTELRVAGTADFSGIEVKGGASFEGAEIVRLARYVDFKVDTWRLEGDGAIDPISTAMFGEIDLRGVTFARVYGDWRKIVEKMAPHSRQPYREFERFQRSIGNDIEAGEIYYAMRKVEAESAIERFATAVLIRASASDLAHDGVAALWEWMQWRLWRFGVRPFRLLLFTVLLIVSGWIVFELPGAVVERRTLSSDAVERQLTRAEALAFSCRTFMPVGEFPMGSRWSPSPRSLSGPLTFEEFAVLEKLGGYFLVPLGLAALTGLLIRRQ